MREKISAKIIVPSLLVSAVIVGGAAWYLGLVSSPGEITIRMREFSYVLEAGDWPLILKAGETYRMRIINDGAVVHEAMVVRDAGKVLEIMDESLRELESLSGEDFEKAFEKMHHEVEEHLEEEGLMLLEADDLAPGEETVMELKLDEPGTYWIVCMEVEGTLPKTHLHAGMEAKIIVEA